MTITLKTVLLVAALILFLLACLIFGQVIQTDVSAQALEAGGLVALVLSMLVP